MLNNGRGSSTEVSKISLELTSVFCVKAAPQYTDKPQPNIFYIHDFM